MTTKRVLLTCVLLVAGAYVNYRLDELSRQADENAVIACQLAESQNNTMTVQINMLSRLHHHAAKHDGSALGCIECHEIMCKKGESRFSKGE